MDLHHELKPKSVERCRREAKGLLRAYRDGDRARDGERERFVLADALHVIASEHGHRSWPAFKHAPEAAEEEPARPVHRVGAFGRDVYDAWAGRPLTAARTGDPDALGRLRRHVPRFDATATEADCHLCLAREYGFRTWEELAETTDRSPRHPLQPAPARVAVEAGRGRHPGARDRSTFCWRPAPSSSTTRSTSPAASTNPRATLETIVRG